jgi:hypothetical protein
MIKKTFDTEVVEKQTPPLARLAYNLGGDAVAVR